jgi:hypothetical protein
MGNLIQFWQGAEHRNLYNIITKTSSEVQSTETFIHSFIHSFNKTTMKLKHFFVALMPILILTSCTRPDLTIIDHSAIWNEEVKRIDIKIFSGGEVARGFYVWLDFKEDPVTDFDMDAVRLGPYDLNGTDTLKITFDAMPFARAENNFNNNIHLSYVSVDHENIVRESNESNNISLLDIR